MPNKFEHAKSNRSTCKHCKEKIQKDEIRFGLESVFKKDGREYPSYKWFHFNCAVEKFPEQLPDAAGADLLQDEQRKIFDELVQKFSFSSFSLQQIGDLTGEEGISSVEATVLKAMPVRFLTNSIFEEKEGRIVYVEDTNGVRRKMYLWKDLDLDIESGDRVVAENAVIEVGNDGLPEVHIIKDASLQINPDSTKSLIFEKFTSDAWGRPSSEFAHFEYAKSNRAGCVGCKEQIKKGMLKIVKPIWGENETTGQKYPGSQSFHPLCIFLDENSIDVLHEAISRLTPPLVSENRIILENILTKLAKDFPDSQAHILLQQILA